MSHGFIRRWHELAQALGMANMGTVGDELLARYSEPHRHFHGSSHLTQVLDTLDELDADPRLKLAAWFHDAIYWPGRGDNEKRSAELARQHLTESDLPKADIDFVTRAVMATDGHMAADPAFAPLLDADLSVLGACPETYESYRDAIRQEFSRVPRLIFQPARARFLHAMLERSEIYRTQKCRLRLEAQARQNLQNELNELYGST